MSLQSLRSGRSLLLLADESGCSKALAWEGEQALRALFPAWCNPSAAPQLLLPDVCRNLLHIGTRHKIREIIFAVLRVVGGGWSGFSLLHVVGLAGQGAS
jgi:hypothetical protein